jgi:hypothetical protein
MKWEPTSDACREEGLEEGGTGGRGGLWLITEMKEIDLFCGVKYYFQWNFHCYCDLICMASSKIDPFFEFLLDFMSG